MTWQPEIEEIALRRRWAQKMGGTEKVRRHHEQGKLTVRQRILELLDVDSFNEVGELTGWPRRDESGSIYEYTPANQVIGWGRVDARPVAVVGDDFTVRGGASDASIMEKLMYPERMAEAMRMPLVRLVDGTGGGGSVKQLETLGHTYIPEVPGWDVADRNLSQVPVISMALGSVAGLGAARVAASHYSLIVKGSAQVFAAGPPLVAQLGEIVSKEELGGSTIHARNGTVDDEVDSEQEAFGRARTFLSYLPSSIDSLPPRSDCNDYSARREQALLTVIPREARKVYAVRPIINMVVDAESFFEIGRQWGRSIVTGFARLDGWPVAVVASDPYIYGGGWTRSSCEKIIRFIDLAETFRLPVIHLVDVPGFQIGREAEQASTIRLGVRAMSAINQTTVPWLTLILRKCFGIAGAAHRPDGRFSMRYAWPSAQWGSLPVAGGLEAAYKRELSDAPDPAVRRQEIEDRLNALSSPILTAERFGIENIIDPRDTRRVLCDFANMSATVRATRGPKLRYRP